MTPEREARLRALSERLGHRFQDLTLLDRALTHTSHAHEAGGTVHNEPLEFLGDAVIGLVIAELLHERDPEGREGLKTSVRGRIVSARMQAETAKALDIPSLLLLGRGEEKTGGRHKQALWADAFEAVVAALYLDGGLPAASRFLRGEFAGKLEAASPFDPGGDAKSALQEYLARVGGGEVDYVEVERRQSADTTYFKVHCVIGGAVAGEGEGYSKKEAQQLAARQALRTRMTGGR